MSNPLISAKKAELKSRIVNIVTLNRANTLLAGTVYCGRNSSRNSDRWLDYLRRTRSLVDRCSIVSEPIGDIPERVNYYTQQSDLKQTKVLFPEYRKT